MKFNEVSSEFRERAKNVKLLLMDCDGVLTDGRLYFSKDGEELKVFHVHDGQGIKNWHDAGFKTGIITGRKSKMLQSRAEELGVHYLIQGSENKIKNFEAILLETEYSANEVAYVGDDLSDLELLRSVNLPIAVGNCTDELRESVLYTTNKNGGSGAVREVVELLLGIINKKR